MPLTIQKAGGIRRNNTTIAKTDALTICTLYDTRIATWDHAEDCVILDTAGYDTPTTIRRMNECLVEWEFVGGPALAGAPWNTYVGKSDFATTNRRLYTRRGLKPL